MTTDARPAPPPVWRRETLRNVVLQILIVAAFAAAAAWLVANVVANFAALDKSFGFDFLWRLPANYDINQTLISYSNTDTHLRAALVGLVNTLAVAVVGCAVATVLGFAVGALRLSGNWLVSRLAAVYVEATRNTPVLLLILLWHGILINVLPHPREALDAGGIAFLSNRGLHLPVPHVDDTGWTAAALLVSAVLISVFFRWRRGERPKLLPIAGTLIVAMILGLVAFGRPTLDVPELSGFNFAGGVTLIPEFVALTWGLAFYTSGFIAEIVRAGILSVDRGQTEAARSLGLSETRTLTLIVLPQALRVIVPPLTSEYLNLTKNSSLAIAIGYMDLVATLGGITLNQTGREMETMILVMGVYLAISLAIAGLMNRYNARLRRLGS